MALLPTLRQHRITYVHISHSPEIRLVCPQCRQQNQKHWDEPGLWFNTAKRVGQCFRCGWSGKEKDLLKLLAVRDVACGEPLVVDPSPTILRPRSTPLPTGAVPASESAEALRYLQGTRGLSKHIIDRFALLYCPEGYFARRVLIPVCNRFGEYRTFVTRAIDQTAEKKYLYPKGTIMGQLLYNLHSIRQQTVYLTEGCFDAIHCFPHAVASFGKKISDAQIRLLRLHGITRVFVLYDAESWQLTPELHQKTVDRLRLYFFTYDVRLPHSTPTEFSLEELYERCRSVL